MGNSTFCYMTRDKIGRNDPCSCGSGKKFKRCHGALEPPRLDDVLLTDRLQVVIAQRNAQEKQREKQQGRGRPIISTLAANGQRLVVVGDRTFSSADWKTFHDFLLYYLRALFGEQWRADQASKPPPERHPLYDWHERMVARQKAMVEETGKVRHAPWTGAIRGVLDLAYRLYLIAHNSSLDERLLTRLRDRDNFLGAFYETFVVASFIVAGFSVDFEDEGDARRTHCEFTATNRVTGRRYSVEAKTRQPGKMARPFAIGNQVYSALSKEAEHTRIVFIEVSIPDEYLGDGGERFYGELSRRVHGLEARLKIKGQPAPPAYLVFTNQSFVYNLDSMNFRHATYAEGFKIPDFKRGLVMSLREAIDTRARHKDLFDLVTAMKEHAEIPATFDGEPAELAFQQTEPRLIIGNDYLVPDENGRELPGRLVDVVVNEQEGVAFAIHDVGGRQIFVTHRLTPAELAAYKRYPETFFGRHKPQWKIEDALGLYDFFYDSYRHTPRELLLKMLGNASDIEGMKDKSQPDLASIVSERFALAGWAQMNPTPNAPASPPVDGKAALSGV